MAHAALEGLEAAAVMAELADAAMGAMERRKHGSEREREAEEALAKERAENERLRSTLDMYKGVVHEFKSKGLLQHMHQLNGLQPDQLCDRLKQRVDSPKFLEKLGSIHMESSKDKEIEAWDVLEEIEETEDYVILNNDDVVDAMATCIAMYLVSQPKAKNMSAEELQKTLSKAFDNKEKPSLFTRIWRTGKVMYNVGSWTATAVGLYRNPMVVRAAFMAIQTTVMILMRLLR